MIGQPKRVIITVHKYCCGKVIFSQVSVNLFTGMGIYLVVFPFQRSDGYVQGVGTNPPVVTSSGGH